MSKLDEIRERWEGVVYDLEAPDGAASDVSYLLGLVERLEAVEEEARYQWQDLDEEPSCLEALDTYRREHGGEG